MQRRRRSVLKTSLGRLALQGAACLALLALVRSIDLHAVGAALAVVGPAAGLVLLPLGAQLVLETTSWRALLSALGHRVRWADAFAVTLRAEAVKMSLPGGPAAAEALRPILFGQRCSVPLGDGAAALTVRKLCHAGTQGLFLGAGTFLGAAVFTRWTPVLGPVSSALPILSWVLAGSLPCAALVFGALLCRASLAARAERLLARLTRGRVPWFRSGSKAGGASIDERLQVLLTRRPATLLANLATAVGGWCLDASETLLVLWVLGVPLGWGDALSVEALVSVVRVLGFAVPGGLGIQDVSYHALLAGTVGDATAMSFILLKRGRDLFWVAAGYLLPALHPVNRHSNVTSRPRLRQAVSLDSRP